MQPDNSHFRLPWTFEAGVLHREVGTVTLRLYPARPDLDAIRSAPPALAPSQFCLYEWVDYRLRVTGAAPLRVRQGSLVVEPDHDGFYSIRYENWLGRSRIAVDLTGLYTIELPVEVLSPLKYPDPTQYLAFYTALLSDLAKQSARLPFAVVAPTQASVTESAAPASPLFILNFFRQYAGVLHTALGMILAHPHRQLVDEPDWPLLSEASDVDSDLIVDMLSHPERLVPAPGLDVLLVRCLHWRVPARVLQRFKRETFDTPENRFVRMALRAFQRGLDELRHQALWPEVPAADQSRLSELSGTLVESARDPLFDEVGEMTLFPTASTVLQKRDGYRELAQLWRLYQSARRPFFAGLQAAIDLRNVAQLYEFWCFFQLAGLLMSVFGQQFTGRIVVSDVQGLEYEAVLEWPGGVRLVYNSDGLRSYSTALRPDFALLWPGHPPIIFDAKFRFTLEAWEAPDEDLARSVQKTDLYKMHTYRDALGAQVALVLYPGNRPVFYDVQRGRLPRPFDLTLVFNYQGVGALDLEPGRETIHVTV